MNYSQKYITSFIAELIHPSKKINEFKFPLKDDIFWENVVFYASQHLVLPAVYSALNRKKLNKNTPSDLIKYLEKLSNLNLNRNNLIFKQINILSDILKKYKIEYVFLKGSALLILKPYDVFRERMIGDIDILISKKDINKAQSLLINHGYKEIENKKLELASGILSSRDRHLNRLVHLDYIAAVELHSRLLSNKNIKRLSSEEIFSRKVMMNGSNWLPSKKHLWEHSVLNYQYNDKGMKSNTLSFRSVLDVLYLEPINIKSVIKNYDKDIKSFYTLLSVFYEYKINYFPFRKFIYVNKLNYRYFYLLCHFFSKLFDFTLLLFSRLFLIINSKLYRQRILADNAKIRDKISRFWRE